MHRKILVTGAAGFIGRHISKEFAWNKCKVIGMGWGNFPEHEAWGISTVHECEVSLETLCEFADKPDVIVHCAGGASVGYSVDHPKQDFALTVDTTSSVLEYIRLYSPNTKLVYPSSAAVYGQVSSEPIQEKNYLEPVSPYGTHKLFAESLCRMYAENYGLLISIVRFFSIYGEGLRKQLLWDACCKFTKGRHDFFGSGEEIRDWLHVHDATKLLYLAEAHASNQCVIVNGGAGRGVKVKNILRRIALSLGTEAVPEFTSEKKAGDPDALVANISSAQTWDWEPQVSWEKGVDDYAKWFCSI